MTHIIRKAPYDNLSIIYLTEKNWAEELTNKFKIIPQNNYGNNLPLAKIFMHVLSHRCKTIIVEEHYIDEDYLNEFSNFYCSTFKPHEKETRRLHFFSTTVEFDDLYNLEKFNTKSNNYYLGYTVIRPIETFRVGRTILKPKITNKEQDFMLAKADFKVNLAGSCLEITGTPFIQQETHVGVCAQAAIWMASLYMHKKFAYPRFLPFEITKLAATNFKEIGHGLNCYDMSEILKRMGFFPKLFHYVDLNYISKIIYSYIESELPVILGIRGPNNLGHAVTVVGHTFNPKLNISSDSDLQHIDWIDNYYINDDARGPYIKVKKEYLENVTFVLVPCPKEVSTSYTDIETHMEAILQNINVRLPSTIAFSPDELSGNIIRTYLIPSNKYKESLLKSGMDIRVRKEYRAMSLPKYIWVSEISNKALLNKNKAADRKIAGEAIFDSTANKHARLGSCLAFHFNGRLLTRKKGEEAFSKCYLFAGESPYNHLVRY